MAWLTSRSCLMQWLQSVYRQGCILAWLAVESSGVGADSNLLVGEARSCIGQSSWIWWADKPLGLQARGRTLGGSWQNLYPKVEFQLSPACLWGSPRSAGRPGHCASVLNSKQVRFCELLQSSLVHKPSWPSKPDIMEGLSSPVQYP